MSGGKEAVWRAELAAAQKAYKQQAAAEERNKNRIAAKDIALDACQRALLEYKAVVPRLALGPSLEDPKNPGKPKKGRADPRPQLVSLGNRALREIKKARDT